MLAVELEELLERLVRVAGAQVDGAARLVEDPAVRPAGRAGPSRRAAAGRRAARSLVVADREQRVVDRDRCCCRRASCRTAPAAGGCRPARPGEETQRLVPSAAALRPSSVVANFQVTNGRPWSIAKVHSRLTRPRLVLEQSALDLDPGGAQGGRSPGGDRVGVALGEHDAAYAGLDQRPRARAGAAGVVARLQGDDGGRAAGGVARLAQRVDLGVRRAGAAVPALGHGAARRRRAARSRRAGWGRSGRRVRRPARARAAWPPCSSCWCVNVSPPVGSTDPGACGRSLRTASRSAQRNRPSCVFPSGL